MICCNGYVGFLIFLIKSMSNAQLAHFSNLFQEVADCGIECVEVKSILYGLHSTNSLKAS